MHLFYQVSIVYNSQLSLIHLVLSSLNIDSSHLKVKLKVEKSVLILKTRSDIISNIQMNLTMSGRN